MYTFDECLLALVFCTMGTVILCYYFTISLWVLRFFEYLLIRLMILFFALKITYHFIHGYSGDFNSLDRMMISAQWNVLQLKDQMIDFVCTNSFYNISDVMMSISKDSNVMWRNIINGVNQTLCNSIKNEL